MDNIQLLPVFPRGTHDEQPLQTIVSELPVPLAPHTPPQAPRTLGHGLRASCRSPRQWMLPPSCCPFWGVALVHGFTQLRRHPEARGWMMRSHPAPRDLPRLTVHDLLPGPILPSLLQASSQKPSASDSGSPDSDQQSLHCVLSLPLQLQPLI